MLSTAPEFWTRPRSLRGLLLNPIGMLVSWITLRRMARAGTSVAAVVICIGNPTVGGSGKTPTVLAVLDALKRRGGARPFALLRGHGGKAAGPLLVDLSVHDVRTVGDEAMLLARAAPTIVARDRVAGAELAVAHGATHIVMDDGFQNPGLVKNSSLLVVDAQYGIGNGRTTPAGPLRARFRDQLERADALLVVGDGPAERNLPVSRRKPIMRAHVRPDAAAVQRLQGRKLLAFAGIGRPEKFFDMLQRIGLDVQEAKGFPDHHPYTMAEIDALVAQADYEQLTLVTTTKDYARLTRPAFSTVRERILPVPVTLQFDDPADLESLIHNAEVRSMLVMPQGPATDPAPETGAQEPQAPDAEVAQPADGPAPAPPADKPGPAAASV